MAKRFIAVSICLAIVTTALIVVSVLLVIFTSRPGLTTLKKVQKMKAKMIAKVRMNKWEVINRQDVNTFYSTVDTFMYNGNKYNCFFILSGGLGDVLRSLQVYGVGRFLIECRPANALIFIVSHNINSQEIVRWFPYRHHFHMLPYTPDLFMSYPSLAPPLEDVYVKYIVRRDAIFDMFCKDGKTMSSPPPWLHFEPIQKWSVATPTKPYIVVSRCAATRERDISWDLAVSMCHQLLKMGYSIVQIGKHHTRSFVANWSPPIKDVGTTDNGNEEQWDVPLLPLSTPNYFSMVDIISLDETYALVRDASAVVTAFTATNMVASLFHVPTLSFAAVDKQSIKMFTATTGPWTFWSDNTRWPERHKVIYHHNITSKTTADDCLSLLLPILSKIK